MINSTRTGVTNSSVEYKTLGRVLGKNSVNDREILAPLIKLGTKVVLSLGGGIDGSVTSNAIHITEDNEVVKRGEPGGFLDSLKRFFSFRVEIDH